MHSKSYSFSLISRTAIGLCLCLGMPYVSAAGEIPAEPTSKATPEKPEKKSHRHVVPRTAKNVLLPSKPQLPVKQLKQK